MSLEAKNLTFRYPRRGKRPVLEDVSLTLEPGERLGLSAPSGRGKTTLCRLLAGYQWPTDGQILLDGEPLSRYGRACPVQMIWQHPETALDPLLPLEVSLHEAGPVEERLLKALHIQPQWLRRYPRELSGGELQRFCIARAPDPLSAVRRDHCHAGPDHPSPDLAVPFGGGSAEGAGAPGGQPQQHPARADL